MAKNKHYSEQYYLERDYLDLHMSESLRIFASEKKLRRILDVGCGTGRMVKYFNEHGLTAAGCDLYDPALKIAKKINKKGVIKKASAVKIPFPKHSFDLLTAISVIEHITQIEANKFLTESYRVLKPGGYIFLITPNYASPLRFILRDKWFGYSDPTHITFYTPKSLTQLLTVNGFGKIQLRFTSAYNIPSATDFHIPNPLRKLPMPYKNFLNYLMVSSVLSTCRDSFWIAAQKTV